MSDSATIINSDIGPDMPRPQHIYNGPPIHITYFSTMSRSGINSRRKPKPEPALIPLGDLQ